MNKRFAIVLTSLLFSIYTKGQDSLVTPPNTKSNNHKFQFQESDLHSEYETGSKASIPNDSSFFQDQINLARIHFKANRYNKAIQVSKPGTEHLNSFTVEFYLILAKSFIQNNQPNEAITSLNKGIPLFPVNAELIYTRALANQELGNHQECINDLQSSLKLNPFEATPHLKLGEYAKKQGEIAKTMMCYNSYFLLSKHSTAMELNDYNTYLESSLLTSTNQFQLSTDNYSEINKVLESGKCLSRKFKTPSKLRSPIIKKNYQLLLLLNARKLSTGFWDEFYVPFHIQLLKDKEFNNWIIDIQRNSSHKKVISAFSKNQEELSEYKEYANNQWKKTHSNYLELLNGKFENVHYYWSSQYTISGKGVVIEQEPTGFFRYYYLTGNLSSTGTFDIDGERIELWTSYYPSTQKQSKTSYQDGEIIGMDTLFYKNGSVKTVTPFENGQPNGIQKNYRLNSIIESEITYSKGVINGICQYYSSTGGLTKKVNYKNEYLDGSAIEYYSTGSVKSEGQYVNGSKNGSFKYFYPNGQPSLMEYYKLGVKTGTWQKFTPDGELQEEQKH